MKSFFQPAPRPAHMESSSLETGLRAQFISWSRTINWSLLLFLILVMDVKVVVKIAGILLLLWMNRSLFRDRSIYRLRYLWFYAAMILLTLVNLLLHPFSINYCIVAGTGILFWVICISAGAINFWFVANTETSRLHATLQLFFALNCIVTLLQLLFIMWDAGSINPYTYQGQFQKYYIGTGDWMTGITFDVSTTNALINAFGIVYFLDRGKMGWVLGCMTILLCTASNLTDALLVLVLLYLFLFQSTRNQKSIILACFFLLVIFMVKISPQNDRYVTEAFRKLAITKTEKPAPKPVVPLIRPTDTSRSVEVEKVKSAQLITDSIKTIRGVSREKKGLVPPGKPSIPHPSIHGPSFQRRKDTTAEQRRLLVFAERSMPSFDTSLPHTRAQKWPGKFQAFGQSILYLKTHPLAIITGAGAGNFASKLAFRATGLGIAGGYPHTWEYISNDFMNNHLQLYLTYYTKDRELHSLLNNPNAVYDQLITEYGFAGLAAFVFFYIAYFARHRKRKSYGLPLLLLLLGACWIDYWFEQVSIVVLFELLLLLNWKEARVDYE